MEIYARLSGQNQPAEREQGSRIFRKPLNTLPVFRPRLLQVRMVTVGARRRPVELKAYRRERHCDDGYSRHHDLHCRGKSRRTIFGLAGGKYQIHSVGRMPGMKGRSWTVWLMSRKFWTDMRPLSLRKKGGKQSQGLAVRRNESDPCWSGGDADAWKPEYIANAD